MRNKEELVVKIIKNGETYVRKSDVSNAVPDGYKPFKRSNKMNSASHKNSKRVNYFLDNNGNTHRPNSTQKSSNNKTQSNRKNSKFINIDDIIKPEMSSLAETYGFDMYKLDPKMVEFVQEYLKEYWYKFIRFELGVKLNVNDSVTNKEAGKFFDMIMNAESASQWKITVISCYFVNLFIPNNLYIKFNENGYKNAIVDAIELYYSDSEEESSEEEKKDPESLENVVSHMVDLVLKPEEVEKIDEGIPATGSKDMEMKLSNDTSIGDTVILSKDAVPIKAKPGKRASKEF